jgi:hypothetical protein
MGDVTPYAPPGVVSTSLKDAPVNVYVAKPIAQTLQFRQLFKGKHEIQAKARRKIHR